MNFVGKILTGVIVVFSLLFMAMILTVTAMHTNWRDKVENPQTGLKKLLGDEKKHTQELTEQKDALVKASNDERERLKREIAALESTKKVLQTQQKDAQDRLDKLDKNRNDETARMAAAERRMEAMDTELKKLRDEKLTAEKSRDESFNKVCTLTEELHQTSNTLTNLKQTNQTLVQDLNKYKQVLDKFNLKGDPAAYADKAPPVDGRVLAVSDAGTGMIEVSIGADQGLNKGHKLEVFRLQGNGSTYLGKVEVVQTEPNRAVVKILPAYQKGAIQKGDHVASQIQ